MNSRFYILLFLLAFAINGYTQITSPTANNSVPTVYTNGATNDRIYIFCSPNPQGQNITGTLSITGSGGTGPYTFNWYNYNLGTNSWVALTTQNGATSTLSNIPSGGYRVVVVDAGGTPRGCYRAWVWVKQTTVDVAAITPGCNPFSLSGSITTTNNYTYYNPPPDPFIVSPTTTITVCLRVTHTYVSDLGFYLIGPPSCGSPFLTLAPHPQWINSAQGCCCNAGNNINGLCFSTTASNMLQVCGSGTPLTGTFGIYGPGTPNNYNTNNNNWSLLYGCDITQGGWRVQVFDCIGGDVGALTNASITFTGNSSCGPSTITFNSGNINSVINDNSCSQGSASIYTVPTPVATPLTLTSTSNYQWSANPAATIANPSGTLTPSVFPVPTEDTWFYLTSTNSLGCVHKDSAFFDYYPDPAPVITPAGPFCTDAAAVNLVANNPGGTWSGTGITNPATGTFNPATAGTGTHAISYITPLPCGDTATTSITVNPLPVINFNPANPAFCEGSFVNVNVSGANTYSWTPATGLSATTGATVSASPAATTTYTVTGTNVSGCFASGNVTVTVNPIPVVTVTPAVPSICNGASTTLTAGGANTYSWSPATGLSATTGTSVTANPTSTNFYTITGTSAAGCVGSHTFILIVTNAVAATITPTDPLCNGSSDGTALTNVTSGSAPFSFLWGNGQTTNPATGLPVGNVNVTITDNVGCTGTASATLTEPTAISSSVTPYVFPGGDNISCTGASDGSADLTVAGGTTPYTFLWSNGQTTEDLNNAPAGNYSVTITDANNCTATNTVSFTEPLAMSVALNSPTFVGGFNISCTGYNDGVVNSILTNGVAPYTYLWNNGSTTQNISNGIAGNQNLTVTDVNGCNVTSIIALTEPPGMTSSFTTQTYNGGYTISCNGASDGSVDLTVNNANGTITYAWSNGATTEDLTNLAAGTFSVLITDANGCTSTASATLTQPAVLAGNLTLSTYNGNVNISCNGFTDGSINTTLSGGAMPYSYNWSSGQTTQNINNIASGNYSVTITDANGCTINLNATLTEPNPLTTSLFSSSLTISGFNITCNGAADGAIDLTVTDGTSPYSFAWSNGQTVEDVYGLVAGNYSITVTDNNGCIALDNTILTEPTAVTATIASFLDVLCNGGNDGSASVNAGGGTPPYSYLWETGQTTAAVINFVAGIHDVTVTDIMGCHEMESITISEPPLLNVSVSGSNVICIGQSTQISATPIGGTTPYIYSWAASPADVSLTPTDQNPTVSPIVPTTYILTLTDANGCVLVADAVSVPVNPPLAVTLSYNGPTGVCPGFSTSINCVAAGGNGIYSWTINSTSGNYTSPYTATPVTTGYYVFTANDNCGTPVAMDSILVTVYPLPVVDFNADTLSGCEPLTVGFTDNTVPTPAAYLWNFGDDNSSISSSPVNTYYQEGLYDVQLIATTSDGCVDSITMINMIEVFPLPTSDFTLSPTVENVLEAWISFNDQSSGAHSWHWDFGDDSTSTLVNPEHFYTDTGLYRIWLTVISQEGCKDSVQREVRITPDFMIYIPNAFTPDENGLNDGFHVHGKGIKPEGFEFRIFTRWGEQIFSTFDVNGTWYGDHNGNGIPIEPGVYVYTVLLKNIHNKVLSYKGHVVVLR